MTQYRIVKTVALKASGSFFREYMPPMQVVYQLQEYREVGMLWWKRWEWVVIDESVHERAIHNTLKYKQGIHPLQMQDVMAKDIEPKVIEEVTVAN